MKGKKQGILEVKFYIMKPNLVIYTYFKTVGVICDQNVISRRNDYDVDGVSAQALLFLVFKL